MYDCREMKSQFSGITSPIELLECRSSKISDEWRSRKTKEVILLEERQKAIIWVRFYVCVFGEINLSK